MNCPACGAPIALKPDTAGFTCDYCRRVFFPGEEDDGVELVEGCTSLTGQACPLCSLPLVKATIGKIRVSFCTQCHGLLVTMSVLPNLIEILHSEEAKPAVQTPGDRGELKRALTCPQCRQRMETHFYSGPGNVIVESCGTCWLIWLDRGELTRIAHAPDESDTAEAAWA